LENKVLNDYKLISGLAESIYSCLSLIELTVFIKIWFKLFFYKTVGFSSAKNKKQEKERENREKKEEKYIFENHNRFEIHYVKNTVRFCCFHNNQFRKRAFT